MSWVFTSKGHYIISEYADAFHKRSSTVSWQVRSICAISLWSPSCPKEGFIDAQLTCSCLFFPLFHRVR